MKLPRWLHRRSTEVADVREVREQLAEVLCEGRRIAAEITNDLERRQTT